MSRDDDHIRRMYGEPDRPKKQPLNYGAIPALWLIVLALFAAGSAIIALGSLWFAVNSGPDELERRGILEPGEISILTVKDREIEGDGCVITLGRIIRYQAWEISAEIPLDHPDQITVRREGKTVLLDDSVRSLRCSADEGALFETVLQGLASARQTVSPGDPR